MKKVKLAGQILALVVLSPLIVVLAMSLLIFFGAVMLGMSIMSLIAQATFNQHHRRLLAELHKTGAVPWQFFSYEDYYWLDYSDHHDHTKCTPRACPIKQAEEYYRLTEACQQEHVPEWRWRWATA